MSGGNSRRLTEGARAERTQHTYHEPGGSQLTPPTEQYAQQQEEISFQALRDEIRANIASLNRHLVAIENHSAIQDRQRSTTTSSSAAVAATIATTSTAAIQSSRHAETVTASSSDRLVAGPSSGPRSVYEEHRRLFGYRPSVAGARRTGFFASGPAKKKSKVKPMQIWKKEVACLRFTDADRVPDTMEKMMMTKMGLGCRLMKFDLDGDEAYLHSELLAEFPELKNTGGYSLLRPNTNSYDLIEIEAPHGKVGGMTIRYLKDIVCSARLYIRPLQFSMIDKDEDEFEKDYDQGNSLIMEKCHKCKKSFKLYHLSKHLMICKDNRPCSSQMISENASDVIDQSRSHCDEEVELQVAIDASLKEAKDTPRDNRPCSSQMISENASDVIDQSRSHCDEEVELQVAIDASLKEAKDTPRERSETLTELLNEHGPIKKLLENLYTHDDFQLIVVSRDNIWSDIQLFFRNNHPNVEVPIKVEFKGEMAIDEGGPKREFLRLGLSTVLKDDALFCGSSQHRIPTKNASAILMKTFVHIGWLMALSIAQGGPGPECLAEWVFSYIEKGLYDAVVHITDIPMLDVQNLLTQLQKAVTNEDVQEALQHSHSSIIYDAGLVIPISHIKLENVANIIRTVCVYATIIPVKGELDQLMEGLKLYDILGLIRSHGNLMKPLFVYKKNRLTAAEFKHFSNLKYSSAFSPSQIERNTTEYWNRFLSELEDGLIGKTCDHHAENADRLSLEELLCFISGARSIPPLEFNFSIEVTFFSDCKKVYPKASTCIPAIRLPYHPSYKEFKAAMVEAIVGGSCVFGQL